MPDGHKAAMFQLLSHIDKNDIVSVLDAGSGKTSLGLILSNFRNAMVDAIVYPGDLRKINSIKSTITQQDRYNLIECDICKELINKEYDVVVAHLLLGEATKFGNSAWELFKKLMAINFNYLILIDYLEDTDINYDVIEQFFDTKNYEVIKKVIITNNDPQKFADFIGEHNIGYLVQRK